VCVCNKVLHVFSRGIGHWRLYGLLNLQFKRISSNCCSLLNRRPVTFSLFIEWDDLYSEALWK